MSLRKRALGECRVNKKLICRVYGHSNKIFW